VELRWRGKETKVKTVSLPFQAAERIDLGGSDWQWEGVEAWSRVVPFEIPCYDEEHGFHCYIPDFIVRADGRYYPVETERAGLPGKDRGGMRHSLVQESGSEITSGPDV
jgi:hypothetical protein